MAPPVSLKEVVDELDILMERARVYLNRETGKLYTLMPDDELLLEDERDDEDLPEWKRKALPRIRDVLELDDWLALPSKFDIHEWEIMDQFARDQRKDNLRDELMGAIRGRGAFRSFKNVIYNHGLQKAWEQYRTEAIERIVIDWLDKHGIAYTQ
ncbi:MAG: UPF0158 family protein [Blastocatellia bacterium]